MFEWIPLQRTKSGGKERIKQIEWRGIMEEYNVDV
jgi:hypothetical protein